jgi:CLIP-associating protein 1/2
MVSGLDHVEVEPVVQVFEDPFVGDEGPTQYDEAEKPVLEELPVNGRANERARSEEFTTAFDPRQSIHSNEQNIVVQRTPRHHKTTSTGSIIANGDSNESMMQQDHTETLRSRRLLASGIDRIRAKTLDAHGFRRVQNLVKGNQDIWGDDSQRFGELLFALLGYLEASNDSLRAPGESNTASNATKAQNLKTQALTTLRAMLAVHRKEAAPYYSRALCSVLVMRKWFEESMHITSDIERTADDVIKFGQPNDSINAVLDLVESLSGAVPGSPSSSTSSISDPSTSPILSGAQQDIGGSNSRTVVLSLSVLGSLLSAAQAKNIPLSSSQTQRLGRVALKFLQDTDADVRKADVDFCLVMHHVLRDDQDGQGKEGEAFWKMMRGVGIRENNVNLITYYLAKRVRT